MNDATERPAGTAPSWDDVDLAGQEPFEFLIERCLITRTTGHGDPSPHHAVWRAPRVWDERDAWPSPRPSVTPRGA